MKRTIGNAPIYKGNISSAKKYKINGPTPPLLAHMS
jgi:hypothetical protein